MPKTPPKPRSKAEVLEELHTATLEQLLQRVRSGTATAADLNVARAFLKDNGVEVRDPGNDEGFKALTDILPFKPAANDK